MPRQTQIRPTVEVAKSLREVSDRRIAANKLIAQGFDKNSTVWQSFYSDI